MQIWALGACFFFPSNHLRFKCPALLPNIRSMIVGDSIRFFLTLKTSWSFFLSFSFLWSAQLDRQVCFKTLSLEPGELAQHCCSSTGPKFFSQHPHSGSQPSVTPVLRNLIHWPPTGTSMWVVSRPTPRQNAHTHTMKIMPLKIAITCVYGRTVMKPIPFNANLKRST